MCALSLHTTSPDTLHRRQELSCITSFTFSTAMSHVPMLRSSPASGISVKILGFSLLRIFWKCCFLSVQFRFLFSNRSTILSFDRHISFTFSEFRYHLIAVFMPSVPLRFAPIVPISPLIFVCHFGLSSLLFEVQCESLFQSGGLTWSPKAFSFPASFL